MFGFAPGVGFRGGGCAEQPASRLFQGYAPAPAEALRIYWAKGRTKGIAQNIKRPLLRRSTATACEANSGGKAAAAPLCRYHPQDGAALFLSRVEFKEDAS
jgi:hypothetical protein